VKISVDTNVLVRLVMGDDETQQRRATEVLEAADLIAVSVQSLCEFAWVLDRSYRVDRSNVSEAVRLVLDMRNVVTDRSAVEAGLVMLESGGDFADGVIAFEGRWLGGDTFVSFDKKAVKLLESQGTAARLLS
jgi:predicted nucleic-acid-binding protein